MAQWAKHMTLSQRNRYNQYMRLRYLKGRIKAGHVPQTRKGMTADIRALYSEAGLANAVYFTQEWMSNNLVRELRREKAKLFVYIRDQLPADISTQRVKRLVDMLAHGKITFQELAKIK